MPDAPRKVGETCAPAACESGLYCDGGLCATAQWMEGDACGINQGVATPGACVAGLRCGNLSYPNGGSPPDASYTCLPLPKAGEPCLLESCDVGLVCERFTLLDGSASLPRCAEPHAEGEACGYSMYTPSAVCRSGLECRAHVCRAACG